MILVILMYLKISDLIFSSRFFFNLLSTINFWNSILFSIDTTSLLFLTDPSVELMMRKYFSALSFQCYSQGVTHQGLSACNIGRAANDLNRGIHFHFAFLYLNSISKSISILIIEKENDNIRCELFLRTFLRESIPER